MDQLDTYSISKCVNWIPPEVNAADEAERGQPSFFEKVHIWILNPYLKGETYRYKYTNWRDVNKVKGYSADNLSGQTQKFRTEIRWNLFTI